MTAPPPIKVLSNEVMRQTATAVGEFFDLCSRAKTTYYPFSPGQQEGIVDLDHSIHRLGNSQEELLDNLASMPDAFLLMPEFPKMVTDLELMVAQVESAVAEAYGGPEVITKLIRANLERVGSNNSHVDSYVESFRVALDETLSANLAEVADLIIGARS